MQSLIHYCGDLCRRSTHGPGLDGADHRDRRLSRSGAGTHTFALKCFENLGDIAFDDAHISVLAVT
jgi:hypothetical protein